MGLCSGRERSTSTIAAVRRYGCSPSFSTPLMTASSSAQAPAALTITAASKASCPAPIFHPEPSRWAECTRAPVMMSAPAASARCRWSASSKGASQPNDPVSRPAAAKDSGTSTGHSSKASACVMGFMWPLASARTDSSLPMSIKLRGDRTGSGSSASRAAISWSVRTGQFLHHRRAIAGDQLAGGTGGRVVRQLLFRFHQGHTASAGECGCQGEAGDAAADNQDIIMGCHGSI